jgi:WD40 repeat protein
VGLWDPATGTTLTTLESHTSTVYAVAFSPDGTRLATADGRTVGLWDPATGTTLTTLESHTSAVYAVAFSPDGTRLATAGSDGTARLWDPATGAALTTLKGHTDWVRSVAFSPDGTRLATGSDDYTVRLWDPATGVALTTLKGHTGWVRSVAFSPDGTRLATGSDDYTVRLWDPATGAALATLKGHTDWVQLVAFSPDGTHLASGGGGDGIRITDITGLTPRVRPWHRFLPVRVRNRLQARVADVGGPIDEPGDVAASFSYSPQGTTIAAGYDSGHVTLRPAVPGSPQPTIRLIGLRDSGWAVLHGERRYELHGDPAGMFWWTAGLCRFEPGELDGYGVERLNAED